MKSSSSAFFLANFYGKDTLVDKSWQHPMNFIGSTPSSEFALNPTLMAGLQSMPRANFNFGGSWVMKINLWKLRSCA